MMSPDVLAGPHVPHFEVHFDAKTSALSHLPGTCRLDLPIPGLHGHFEEKWLTAGATPRQEGSICFLESSDHLHGAVVVNVDGRLEEPIRAAYAQLLEICTTRGFYLHRIWNYVPHINETDHGLERYRQFNLGRWMAFEQRFGRDLRAYMPAASGVGIGGSQFILSFIAGKTHPVYLENPSQVPAYHYPSDYGPKPPSFARAVLVTEGGTTTGYLSGTASIEGHRTVGEGDWHTQFRTTMHNIEIMFDRMDMVEALRGPEAAAKAGIVRRDFKCYLRHAEALPLIKDWLTEELGLASHQATFLQADICRQELDLEIEAVVEKRTLGSH